MAKAGRPKSGKPVRDMVVSVRLTRAEYRSLQGLAMKQGRPLGELLRALALAGMPAGERQA
jgi:hypothetical protein